MDLRGVMAAYRRTPAGQPKEARLGWLPHGRCARSRSNANVEGMTGFVCGDIDGVGRDRAGRLREAALRTGSVAFAGRSASGQGLHILVPVLLPQAPAEARAEFARLAPLAQDWMERTLGCPVDRACKDPSRFLYAGSDPRAAVNLNATPPELPALEGRTTPPASDRQTAMECLRAIGVIAPREDWLRALAAAKRAGVSFRDAERLIGDGKDPQGNRRTWDSLDSYGGVPAGVGTLVHMARAAGARIRVPRRPLRRRQTAALPGARVDPYWFHRALAHQIRGRFGFDSDPAQRRWRRLRAGAWEPCGWRDALKAIQAALPATLEGSHAGGFSDWGRKADRLAGSAGYRAGVREWLEMWLTVDFPARRRCEVSLAGGFALDCSTAVLVPQRARPRSEEVFPAVVDPDGWRALFASAGSTAEMAQATFCAPLAGVLDGYLDRATWLRLVQLAGVRGLLGQEGERFVTLTGVGGSGKGTFVALLRALFGRTAMKLPRDVFLPSRSGHNGPLKRLLQRDPRIAWIEEVGGSRMLAAAIKDSTGSDAEPLEARAPYDREAGTVRGRMRALLVMVGNAPPKLAVDSGILRRWMAFGFRHRVGEPDGEFKESLDRFAVPLLALMVRACMDYLDAGKRLLPPTGPMRAALASVVEQSDALAAVLLRHAREIDGRNAAEILRIVASAQERNGGTGLEVRKTPAGSALFDAGRKVTLNRVATSCVALGAVKEPRTRARRGGFRFPAHLLAAE